MLPTLAEGEEAWCGIQRFPSTHQIAQVADMARRFPGVNIVVDHLAMIDIAAPDAAGFGPLLKLQEHPNVYIRVSMRNLSKSSQAPYRDVWPFLQRIYDRFGPRRMIWTNFFALTIVRDLIPFFTAVDKEWILGRNHQDLVVKWAAWVGSVHAHAGGQNVCVAAVDFHAEFEWTTPSYFWRLLWRCKLR